MTEKWQAKISLEVKGPQEGPVVVTVEYNDTTRKMCESLQNSLAKLGLELNKAK